MRGYILHKDFDFIEYDYETFGNFTNVCIRSSKEAILCNKSTIIGDIESFVGTYIKNSKIFKPELNKWKLERFLKENE